MLFHPLYRQLCSDENLTRAWRAVHRKSEAPGLVERFRDAVLQINAGSAMLKEMEAFETHLTAPHVTNGQPPNGRSLLPEIPLLNWPGKPAGPEPTRACRRPKSIRSNACSSATCNHRRIEARGEGVRSVPQRKGEGKKGGKGEV